MSHHYSGPDLASPHGDARLDLCDLFAFPKPEDASKSIIIMDMHPSSGVNPPGPTTTEPFAPEAIYELKIDINGDAVADIAYRVRFARAVGGAQTATVRRAEGADAAGMGEGGEIVVQGAPVSMGPEAQVTQASDYRFFAGWRSDPFFSDVEGIMNNFQFTGHDYFADKNVCSIALELPNHVLGPTPGVGLWHRVLLSADGHGTGWVQVDRGARAGQSVFFCPGEEKALYHGGEPAHDARFVDSFAHAMEHAGGYTPEAAKQAARTLLPDILPYDYRRPARYPSNGRVPTDDVNDYFLNILTNGKVSQDNVDHHTDLLAEFPYLGPPHKA